MFIDQAFAETTANTTNNSSSFYVIFVQLLPFILIFVVFYLILILPQKRKQKAHKKLIDSVKVGDKVVLNSGIVGKVSKVKDNDLICIKTAEDTEIEVLRNFISTVLPN